MQGDFYVLNQIRVYGGVWLNRGCTKRKPPPLSDEGAVRGRWHRCRLNIEFVISLAPMTVGVSYLHESYLTITVKLSFNSAQNNMIWFSCWCTTLPPPRFRYLLSFLYLRGGPPPLHSRRRLRSGGTTFELSSIKFKLQSPLQTEIWIFKSSIPKTKRMATNSHPF